MVLARSAHFGLDFLDPAHYQGRRGELAGGERDARAMEQLARSAGYQTQLFLTPAATCEAFARVLSDAVTQMISGDFLLITLSGHGSQVPDVGGDEQDQLDEAQCLYNGLWLDDQTDMYLRQFQPGVQVLFCFDTCHSGDGIRALGAWDPEIRVMPRSDSREVYLANKPYYDLVSRLSGERSLRAGPIVANVIELAACTSKQIAWGDAANGGQFTSALLRTWQQGRFRGNYSTFLTAIRAAISTERPQTPVIDSYGQTVSNFLAQMPFTPGVLVSQPASSTTPQSPQIPWGIPSSIRQTQARDLALQNAFRATFAALNPDEGRAAGPQPRDPTPGIPTITRELSSLAASSRSNGDMGSLISSLGDAGIGDDGRVRWVPPDGLSPTIRAYFQASVEELNNYIDIGTVRVDDSGGNLSLVSQPIFPNGTFVTDRNNSATLYRVNNGRRELMSRDDFVGLTLSQDDVTQLDTAMLTSIPLIAPSSRALGRPVDAHLYSDMRAGHLLESWAHLEGTTLTTRTITQARTWFGGWTAGVRFDLYDGSGQLLTLEPIRYRYGQDGTAFGSGYRDDTETAQVSQTIADATESILISHYWDPKRPLVDTLIEVGTVIWWVIQEIRKSQEQGQEVNAGS